MKLGGTLNLGKRNVNKTAIQVTSSKQLLMETFAWILFSCYTKF